MFGLLAANDTLNLNLRNNDADTLVHKNVVTQRFGDFDRDGDLDLLQLLSSTNGNGIVLYENVNSVKNLPPGRPFNPVVATIFNRLFMYWEKPEDDHTPVASLTYDVSLQSTEKDLVTGQFDLFNGRRLLVSHGNNGTTNYALIRMKQPGSVNFSIQAVDNAFHAGPDGVCSGSGGAGSGACSDIETVNIEACKNEIISLIADAGALWFSFAEGFLAETSMLNFNVQQADTVFSMLQQGSACAFIKVYTINTPPTLTKISDTIDYVCEGDLLRLEVEPDWPQVEWISASKGFLSNEDTLQYVVSLPDTVKVKLSDGMGCNIQRNTILQISKPVIDVAHDAYQIMKGESVHLSVTEGAAYSWIPASGLSDPHTSNPIASPLRTTEYLVTVKDSIGCSAAAQIIVVVEETAFIPNLFTPNQDGKNDALKIYGLGQVTNFSFSIYNRGGNPVYDTKDISEAVNNGWNGTARGIQQPAGVYYWMVNGETGGGKRLQLNGKNSGSIVLVR